MITNAPKYHESGLVGAGPGEWYGLDLPDGDREPWATAPIGSVYLYRPTSAKAQRFFKVKTSGRNDDWVNLRGALAYRLSYTDFTDGGSTTGTYTVAAAIPAGSFVERALVVNLTGFTGDSSATIQVGDGSTVARYSTGTPSVYTTGDVIDLGAVSGTAVVSTASAVVVTITSGSDFTAIAAGALTLVIFYRGINL